jgi:hypothetical protein
MECIAVCPAEGALDMSLPQWAKAPNHGRFPAWSMAVGIAVVFLGIVGYAKTAGYWNGEIPNFVYQQIIPHADEVGHPAE